MLQEKADHENNEKKINRKLKTKIFIIISNKTVMLYESLTLIECLTTLLKFKNSQKIVLNNFLKK